MQQVKLVNKDNDNNNNNSDNNNGTRSNNRYLALSRLYLVQLKLRMIGRT